MKDCLDSVCSKLTLEYDRETKSSIGIQSALRLSSSLQRQPFHTCSSSGCRENEGANCLDLECHTVCIFGKQSKRILPWSKENSSLVQSELFNRLQAVLSSYRLTTISERIYMMLFCFT